ncbi:MAG: CvpA family protein, partial [Oceanibaculum nanhaiense]|nr:CvpA family protein [Oceanibaculum nanhaiense]
MENLPVNATDILVFAILLVSGLLAFFRGFVREVLSVGAWVGAAFSTLYGFQHVRPYARDLIGIDMVADIAAGVGLFIIALIILSVVSNMLAGLVKGSALNAVDRSLGFLFGLLRGAVLVCLAFLVLDWAVAEQERPNWITNAKTMPLVERGAGFI